MGFTCVQSGGQRKNLGGGETCYLVREILPPAEHSGENGAVGYGAYVVDAPVGEHDVSYFIKERNCAEKIRRRKQSAVGAGAEAGPGQAQDESSGGGELHR